MKYRTYRYDSKVDDYLRAHKGIDPKLLADDLGKTESHIRMRQRKLGLRPCASTRRYRDETRVGRGAGA